MIGTRAYCINSTSLKSSESSSNLTKPEWNSCLVMYCNRKMQIASMSVYGKWTSSEYEPNSVTLTYVLVFSSSSVWPFYLEIVSAQFNAVSSSILIAFSLSLCFFWSSYSLYFSWRRNSIYLDSFTDSLNMGLGWLDGLMLCSLSRLYLPPFLFSKKFLSFLSNYFFPWLIGSRSPPWRFGVFIESRPPCVELFYEWVVLSNGSSSRITSLKETCLLRCW